MIETYAGNLHHRQSCDTRIDADIAHVAHRKPSRNARDAMPEKRCVSCAIDRSASSWNWPMTDWSHLAPVNRRLKEGDESGKSSDILNGSGMFRDIKLC